MRHPLLPITVVFAAGIWSAPHFFLSASQQVFLISLMVLAALVLLRMERYSYGFAVALLGFFLCGTFLAAEEHSVLPAVHVESLARRGAFEPEKESKITGWMRTASVKRPGGEYFDFELESVAQSDVTIPATGTVRLFYFASRNGPPFLDLPYGTRLKIPVRSLRRPRNFMTPGFYDSEGNMIRQGIYFTGIVRRAEDVERLPGRAGDRWRAALYGLRGRLLASLDRLYPPEQDPRGNGTILKAMLLSDNNWLRPETTAAFQESGTYHLLVVAGLHVAALVFGLFAVLSWFRAPKWLETFVVGACLFVFTFLADARIPAVRASLMISVYLLARLVYRERALLNSIAAAALFLLILHPSDLADSGFQLSFLAVLIIGAMVAPIADWKVSPWRQALRGLDEKERDVHLEPRHTQFRHDVRILVDRLCGPSRLDLRRWRFLRALLLKLASWAFVVAEAIVAVVLIQTGLSLSMALYFNRVVWSGIAANLLVLPLLGVVIPLGFVVLLVSMIWWRAAVAGAHLLGVLVSLLHAIADWSARLPGIDRRVPTPPGWVVALFLATLLLIAFLAARRSWLVWPSVAALVPLGLLLTFAPYRVQIPQGRLELTVLDVGQGDSLFLVFPRGHTMLIDGGGEIPIPGSPPPRLEVGERIVSPYLWSRSLKAVDVVALTHAHSDHVRGLMSVLRNFRVGELWIGPGPSEWELERLLELARSRGVPVIRRQSGDKMEIDGVTLEVLSPPADWSPKRVSNNDSLVMRLGYGTRHMLLAGDAESRMEKLLVKEEMVLASDVLKVGHHGSKTSTTAPFLSRVAPRFGIISVGPFSRFGHPNREVLDVLDEAHVQTFRTDGDGSVTASTDGNRIEITRFRDSLSVWPMFHVEPWPLALLSW